MKKSLTVLFALCCLSVAFGQDAKQEQVAVYTTDESGKNMGSFVGDYIADEIVKRGEYIAIERSGSFLKELKKEISYQQSGNVEDKQLAELAKNWGAQKVCVVKVGNMGAELYVSARIVDVVTTQTEQSARPVRFKEGDYDGMEKACEAVVTSIFGSSGISRPNTKSNSNSGSKTNGSTYNPDGLELVYVEGTGSGIMSMPCFYIGKYEVTQAQWEAVMGSNPSNFKGVNNPVEQVSWNDVKAFISKLNSITGRNYRLPTEKEWAYAAGEGNKNSSYEYSGSNSIDEVAWYTGNSGNTTHTVGTKKPNALGIYDMSGNVWEWCEDWYDSSQTSRVYRGGSWDNIAAYCRVSIRSGSTPTDRYYSLGFRLALSL